MNSNPKISIILPCYKSENCIANMIGDIQRQTYQNWELIIVSNGKDQDAQLKVISEFSANDKRITCHTTPAGGQGPARNIGIGKASGEWITFVDADDNVAPFWLERYMAVANLETDVIVSEYCHNRWTDKTLRPCRIGCEDKCYNTKLTDSRLFVNLLLKNEHIVAPPWNKLFSSKFLHESELLFPSVMIYEDHIFNFIAATKYHSLCFIKDGGYTYNVLFNAGIVGRYNPTLDEGSIMKIETWCDAYKIAGATQDQIDSFKLIRQSEYSFQALLNTFRFFSPHTFQSRVQIVKEQFNKPWMADIGKLYTYYTPQTLERIYHFFYRINSPSLCVFIFTALYWVRRHMQHTSGFILRHIG